MAASGQNLTDKLLVQTKNIEQAAQQHEKREKKRKKHHHKKHKVQPESYCTSRKLRVDLCVLSVLGAVCELIGYGAGSQADEVNWGLIGGGVATLSIFGLYKTIDYCAYKRNKAENDPLQDKLIPKSSVNSVV